MGLFFGCCQANTKMFKKSSDELLVEFDKIRE